MGKLELRVAVADLGVAERIAQALECLADVALLVPDLLDLADSGRRSLCGILRIISSFSGR